LREHAFHVRAGIRAQEHDGSPRRNPEEFAKTYFPGENPVGQHIAAPGPDAKHDDDVEIVGVSANAKYGNFRGQSKAPVVYFLYNHVSRPPITQMVFELRTAGNPLTYANTVREIVRKADPGVPVSNIKTQAAEVDERINQETWFRCARTALWPGSLVTSSRPECLSSSPKSNALGATDSAQPPPHNHSPLGDQLRVTCVQHLDGRPLSRTPPSLPNALRFRNELAIRPVRLTH
jgi:hypothetical protein